MKFTDLFKWYSWKAKSQNFSAELRKLRKRNKELISSRDLSKRKQEKLKLENEDLKKNNINIEV